MKAAQAAGEEAPQGARSVKVVLVGDGGCGKTSLLMVFADGDFPEVSASALATVTHGLPCVLSVRELPVRELPRMCAHAGLQRGLPAECGVKRGSHSAFGRVGLYDIIWENGIYLGGCHRAAGRVALGGGTAWLSGTDLWSQAAWVRMRTLPFTVVCPWASPLPSLCLCT